MANIPVAHDVFAVCAIYNKWNTNNDFVDSHPIDPAVDSPLSLQSRAIQGWLPQGHAGKVSS
jgi:hypothetical protein